MGRTVVSAGGECPDVVTECAKWFVVISPLYTPAQDGDV